MCKNINLHTYCQLINVVYLLRVVVEKSSLHHKSGSVDSTDSIKLRTVIEYLEIIDKNTIQVSKQSLREHHGLNNHLENNYKKYHV